MQLRDILNLKGNTLFTIGPDILVSDAVGRMVEHDIGSLVVMHKGHLAGILTFREILKALHDKGGNLGSTTIGEIMVKDPIIGNLDDSVDYVRGVMTDHHVRYLPVMEDDTLHGIISFHDVAKACINQASFENRLLKRYIKHWPDSDSQ